MDDLQPAELILCWHCATNRPRPGSRLCGTCEHAGADPVWVPCTGHGNDHLSKRTRRGQQTFTCRHPDRPLTTDTY